LNKKPKVKYFICALGSLSLGIPAEQTEKIIPVTRVQTGVVEKENQETYISIPALFQQKDTPSPHGLVLKGGREKTILLTPKIEVDLEIPEEKISRLPGFFGGAFSFFRGACFADANIGDAKMIFILDPEKLRGQVQ